MPMIFSHYLILHSASDHPELRAEARALIRSHPKYANWGAIGPDYLYFYDGDWGIIGHFTRLWYDFKAIFEDVTDLWETVQEAHDSIDDWLSGGLHGDMRRNAEAVQVTIRATLAKYVTDQHDFFDEFQPPFYAAPDEASTGTWWWSDIVHHRRSSNFLRAMWTAAQGNGAHMAYCLGFASHVGGDITGHPFVNMICGGPFRLHWRRHALVERVFDAYLWHAKTGNSLSDSDLQKEFHFTRTGYNKPKLPDDLAALIAKAINDTYADLRSDVPDAHDIGVMYDVFYDFLKGSASFGGLNLPPPPDFDPLDLPDWIRRKLESWIDRMPKLGGPPKKINDLGGWKIFFRSLFRYGLWLLEGIIMIATIEYAAWRRLETLPQRYLLWLMLRLIYELYDKVRLALAMGGYIHPEPAHLRYFSDITEPENAGYVEQVYEVYPYQRVFNSQQTYHLVHPVLQRAGLETPNARVYTANARPSFDLVENFLGHQTADLYSLIDACQPFPNQNVSGQPLISGATASVAVMNALIDSDGVDLPNWNLDGDRGFGWPSWTAATRQWTNDSDFSAKCQEG